MAIVKASEHLKDDYRFKSWAKSIRKPCDVDLALRNGYSLCGEWVKFGEAVPLGVCEFLACAAETGSRANHSYDYALVEGGETARLVPMEEMKRLLEDTSIPEAQRAKARNSKLYLFALYAHTRMRSREESARRLLDAEEAVVDREVTEEAGDTVSAVRMAWLRHQAKSCGMTIESLSATILHNASLDYQMTHYPNTDPDDFPQGE